MSLADRSIFDRHLNPLLTAGPPAAAPPRPEDISLEVGIPVENLIRLSANEAPLGPSPMVREALAEASQSPVLHRYPNRTYRALTSALASFVGAEEREILPTAGASEVLPLAMTAFCPPGSRVAYVHPGIPRVGREASQRGLDPLRVDFDWPYEVTADDVTARVPTDTRLLFITSPNNTTSRLVEAPEIAKMAEALPDTIIFVDEHYVEAAGSFRERSAVSLLGTVDNVIVARTFSKVHGMAGLRVGYAVAPEPAISAMRRVGSRWPISVPSEAAALAALGDVDHFEANRKVIAEGRSQVVAGLSDLDSLELVPEPEGNFVLARAGHDPKEVMERLWRHGVLINGFLLAGHIRITIGTHEMNRLLVEGLAAVTTELGSEQAE